MKRLDALTILRKAMDGKIEKNFFHYHIKASTIADLGFGFLIDIRSLCLAQENHIGFLREAIILNVPSRNQAKRLRTRVRLWLDAEIAKELATQCAERGQTGFEAGEKLKHMADMYMFDQSKEAIEAVRNFWGEFKDGKRPRSVMKECRLEQMPDIFTQEGRNEIMQQSQAVPPSGFPPSHGNRMAHLIAARKAKEAAKDAEIEQLKAALEAANLTKDGALKTAQRAIAERDNLKTTNAELVRQAQAHNQEAIQLREALDNMTRLRNEALGKSVRLPNEGETIEVKDIFTGAWSEVAAKAFANGRIGVPVKFGVMWTEAPNYGITWRWPTKKERTATDAKPFDSVWLFIHGKKLLGRIDHFDDPEVVCTYSQAAGWRRQARILIDSFGKSWGFAD